MLRRAPTGFSKGFRGDFRDTCHSPKVSEGGSVGGFEGSIRQGFGTTPKGFRDTRHAPKGSERGVLRGGTSRRGLRKDFREGLRMVPERVFRTDFRRASGRVSKWVFEGGWASGRLPRRAALVVGFKIYDPGWPASSDRPNGQAVPGRPIGDQRRACVGRLSSSGSIGEG